MSNTASTITIIIAVCAVTTGVTLGAVKLLGDSLRDAIGELRVGLADVRTELRDVRGEIRDLRGDVSTLERTIVREHGERITRLEERL